MGTGRVQNGTDTTRMFRNRAEGFLEVYSNPWSALETGAENGNFEKLQRLLNVCIA